MNRDVFASDRTSVDPAKISAIHRIAGSQYLRKGFSLEITGRTQRSERVCFALDNVQPTILHLSDLRLVTAVLSPLTFEPIFRERIWGGRKLAELFGKKLPPDKRIGESWEIVDRPEAQSVVSNSPFK